MATKLGLRKFTFGTTIGKQSTYDYQTGPDGIRRWYPKPGTYGEYPMSTGQPISSLSQKVTGNIDSFELGGDFPEKTEKTKYKSKYYSVVWFWSSAPGKYDLRVEAGVYYYVREDEEYNDGPAKRMLDGALSRSGWLSGAKGVGSLSVNAISSNSKLQDSSVESTDAEYRAGGFTGFGSDNVTPWIFERATFRLEYKERRVEEFVVNNQYAYKKQ